MGIKFDDLPLKIKEQIRRDNPDVFRKVETAVTERSAVSPLDGGSKQRKESKGSVAIVVTLVSLRSRLSDDDAIAASIKPLRDAIANSLGLDDADARIKFEYGQIQTNGEEGVLVSVQHLCQN